MAELTFKGSNLRRADKSVWFWIAHGWIDEAVEVRGEDRIVALRHGQLGGPRWKSKRKPELRGRLKAATSAGMLTLQQELLTIFDPTVRGALVVGDGYKGLAALQTATLSDCLPLSVIGADVHTGFHRLYTVTMESIAVPPEWVIA